MWKVEALKPAFQELPALSAALAVVFLASFAFWSSISITRNKPGKLRGTFSSCVISIIHAGATIVLASDEIYRQWPLQLDGVNTSRQTFLMQFSTAYMAVDLLCFLLPFTPDDALFIGHHFMTASYMLLSLWLGRGGISCLVLMALGESTSWLQNGFYLSRDLRRDSPAAMRAFKAISPVYTWVFVLVRSCVGPPAIAWLARRLVTEADKVPAGIRYFWAACGILGVTGSQLWTYKLVRGFMKQRRTQSAAAAVSKKAR